MRPSRELLALAFCTLSACAVTGNSLYSEHYSTVEIDGEMWTLVRESEKCQMHASAAVARYWDRPLFSEEREVRPDRFLVNESLDCWIELSIDGVTDISVIFKVSRAGNVVDQKVLSEWLPRTSPYPERPISED